MNWKIQNKFHWKMDCILQRILFLFYLKASFAALRAFVSRFKKKKKHLRTVVMKSFGTKIEIAKKWTFQKLWFLTYNIFFLIKFPSYITCVHSEDITRIAFLSLRIYWTLVSQHTYLIYIFTSFYHPNACMCQRTPNKKCVK